MTVADFETYLAGWRKRTLNRDSGHAYVRLAELLIRCDRQDEALEVLEQGITSGPACHGGLLQLGKLLLDRGRDLEARSHLLHLLAQDPENTKALALLADHARVSGRSEEAARFFQRLVELEPEQEAWSSCLQQVRAGRHPRSVENPPREGQPPRKPLPTMTLVDIYLAQGYQDRALAVLQDMLTKDPLRTDVRSRMEELENKLTSDQAGCVESVDASGADQGGQTAGGPDKERLARAHQHVNLRRSAEKHQFQAWVNQLRRERKS